MRACLPDWVPFGEENSTDFTKCIKAFSSFRMTWQQAEETCSHLDGSHLVSISTSDEAKWLNIVVCFFSIFIDTGDKMPYTYTTTYRIQKQQNSKTGHKKYCYKNAVKAKVCNTA